MSDFLNQIYLWYNINKRDLPLRKTTDPYKIWVSEIILQQTRIINGIGYYKRFVETFPTIKIMAQAEENQVLKIWQGLGYYSRARNLHSSAKYINDNLNGKFPEDYNDIIQLKGVGPYTAAAIASIAFDLPYPAVDANIYRVFSRYFGISTPIDSEKGKKEFYKVAKNIMPEKNAGMHNQALMEFGALQCTPKLPRCSNCPVSNLCFAAKNKSTGLYPVKSKKSKQTNRFFYYYFIKNDDFIYIEKRIKNDIWKNMYQFPLFESDKKLSIKEIISNLKITFNSDCKVNVKTMSTLKKHVLSHQIIFARFVHIKIEDVNCLDKNFIRVNKKDIFTFAVPRLIEQFIEELNLR